MTNQHNPLDTPSHLVVFLYFDYIVDIEDIKYMKEYIWKYVAKKK